MGDGENLPNLLLLELRSIALEASTDIAHTECPHAGNRKEADTVEGGADACGRLVASTHYVGRCLRSSSGIGFAGAGVKLAPVIAKRRRGRKKVKPKAVSQHFLK